LDSQGGLYIHKRPSSISNPSQDQREMRWGNRRRWLVVWALCGSVLALGLFLPTLVGSWAPVVHSACQAGPRVLFETAQVPALLINSPYGGHAWANVTFPSTFLPGGLFQMGSQSWNGSTSWSGFQSNVSVYGTLNETVWGPGPNVRCTQPYFVSLAPIGNPSLGIWILGPGNTSDHQEPNVLFVGGTITFSNGFQAPNEPDVSTCGGSSQSISMSSYSLTLWVSFQSDGGNRSAPVQLPIVVTTFHYWFPSDFGIWQIENLSAPGGPGGGWAFSYSPC